MLHIQNQNSAIILAHTKSLPFVLGYHLALKRCLKRPLGLRRDAGQVAALPVLPVDEGRVLRDAVVPHDDGALLPLDTRLEVAAKGEVVVQELEQRVRLFLLQAYNVARDCCTAGLLLVAVSEGLGMEVVLTLGIHINRLLPRHRMRPHNGMLIDNRLAALNPTPRQRRIRLLDGRVCRAQAVQPLLEEGAQPIIGLDRVGKERVAARRRLVENVQERGAGRLLLVGYVRVPRYRARAVCEKTVDCVVAGAPVHEVDLGVVGGCARGRVDVVAVGEVSQGRCLWGS